MKAILSMKGCVERPAKREHREHLLKLGYELVDN
jgi:hypothetical protein